MNLTRLWLSPVAAAWLALAAAAAPVPVGAPESQGPVSDALRARDKLPPAEAPQAMKVVLRGEALEVGRRVIEYRTEEREATVEGPGGRVEKVKYAVAIPVTKLIAATVPAKDCKFFTVMKEGKLEAVAPDKAAVLLKQPTAVLTGNSAEVDPRHLETVKPGTLYVVVPSTTAEALPPPPPPLGAKPER
jgi:hypothetical protein